MPLLGNKKQRSETACSNEPTAAALTPSINTTLPVSPNVSVNDYIVKQIKSSLEFLVANQGISVYKQSRIGALLDAGLNDEEAALLDKAKFSPKKRNSEETNEQGPVAAWFESTLAETLPDLIVSAVGIIGIPLGSAQEEALSTLCDNAAPTIARTLASRETRDNVANASLLAAKSSQQAMLKGARATQNAFKKKVKSASTSAPETETSTSSPTTHLFEPQPLEVTLQEAPDDKTRVFTTTLEPEPGRLLSVMHIYQTEERILSTDEKKLLESRRKVSPPVTSSKPSSLPENSQVQQQHSQRNEAVWDSTKVPPLPPPRHPKAKS